MPNNKHQQRESAIIHELRKGAMATLWSRSYFALAMRRIAFDY